MFTRKIQKALETAAYLHRNQIRKGTLPLPYITHLVSTMLILSSFTSDEDVLCAALLHDVLEDIDKSEYTDEDMIRDFGQKIFEIVSGVTEDSTIREWKLRKETYIKHLRSVRSETLMVSVADKIHNLMSLIDFHKRVGNNLWKDFEFSAEDNIWYHESVLKVVEHKIPDGLYAMYKTVIEDAKTEYKVSY